MFSLSNRIDNFAHFRSGPDGFISLSRCLDLYHYSWGSLCRTSRFRSRCIASLDGRTCIFWSVLLSPHALHCRISCAPWLATSSVSSYTSPSVPLIVPSYCIISLTACILRSHISALGLRCTSDVLTCTMISHPALSHDWTLTIFPDAYVVSFCLLNKPYHTPFHWKQHSCISS